MLHRSDSRRAVPSRHDQADALRRRRLSDPVAPLGDPVQYAGLPQRRSPRTPRRARCSGRTSKSASTPIDETNGACGPTGSSARSARQGGKALIGLVGVQSNQFPRAVDLAGRSSRPACRWCIGGFHVSGCISMLPEMPPEMREAQALGISFFAGEAEEGRLDQVLRDAWDGTLKPLYNYMDDLPGARRRADADPAAQARARARGLAVELRSRPRLPLPMLVLHHHQRAGPQEPLPLARRSRDGSSARTSPRASSASSSPTTISPATATGRSCSTA